MISQKLTSNSNSSIKSNTECISELKKVRINNINDFIIATLNINSLVSKFDELKFARQGSFDILIINKTKLDSSFLVNQFCINVFSIPYRLDQNGYGVGIIIYVQEEKCKQKKRFQMILKHYLLKLIFKIAIEFFVDYITHLLNVTNTFLIT